jgi:2,3-dihydroxybiphenyl 1,2-dioxygenase
MAAELELGYIGFEVDDRDAFETFLADVVGLTAGASAHTWRNDDKVQRVVVDQGSRNDATFLGFEAADRAGFDARVESLGRIGFDVTKGTDDEKDVRKVEDLAWCTAPWGTRLEIALGLQTASPFASSLMPGGFLTANMGFGHAVFAAPDLPAADRFVTDGLGLAQSDWLEMDAGGFTLEVRFYHCNARHHSLALAGVPFDVPTKLHHFMLETNNVDDVGAAWDRVWNAELPIANGLGKHPNDEMFSFYVVTPAGFQLEIGHGARIVSEPWTDNHVYDRISAWGHQPIPRP